MSGVRVEVEGLAQLVRALRNNANVARPLEQALHTIGLQGSSDSKRAATVDVGLLRGRITY